jgi:tetratricopeptide (TPR) repeat protein
MKMLFFSLIWMIPWIGMGQLKADSEKHFELGEAAYLQGKYEEALSLFTRSLQEDPSFTEAYFSRAKTKENLKDYEGALTDLNICLELKPDQPEVLFSKALVEFRLERYALAKSDFLKLLQLPAGETYTVFYQRSASARGSHQIITTQGSMRHLLYNHIGMTETKLGNFKAAIHWFDSAIALENKAADYYVNRGMAREGLSDPAAADDYQKALTLRSDHPVALNNLAVLKRKIGQKDTTDELDQAIESDSSMLNPYLERAYLRMEGGYLKGALQDYDAALSIQDKDPEIWLNRGLVKERLSDLKGAYADYTKAISLKESFVKAWLNRGNVLMKQNQTKDAVDDYSAAITYSPDYAVAYYNRALAYNKLKQSRQACEDLKKAELLGQFVEEKVRKELCK